MSEGNAAHKQFLLDSRYLRMAQIWAENSYCRRRQVGALIVKDKMIISDGYNGTPVGFENVCEDDDNHTKAYVLHAEANAITKVAQSNNSSSGGYAEFLLNSGYELRKLKNGQFFYFSYNSFNLLRCHFNLPPKFIFV